MGKEQIESKRKRGKRRKKKSRKRPIVLDCVKLKLKNSMKLFDIVKGSARDGLKKKERKKERMVVEQIRAREKQKDYQRLRECKHANGTRETRLAMKSCQCDYHG